MRQKSKTSPVSPAEANAPVPGSDAHAAISALYRQNVEDVDRWVRRLAGPGHDAADLIHDVFLVAIRQWKDFRGDSTPRTWLFAIAQKVVASRRRKERLRKWLSCRWGISEQPEPSDGTTTLDHEKRCASLYAALDQLAEKYRTPLVLFELEGYSGQEIALILDIEVNAVWVRLHRGRELLRKALKKASAR